MNTDSRRIGWIGTGVMGSAMAARLLEAGYPLSVCSRTKSKAADLVSRGAIWRETPAETAAQSDIIFTMVGYPSELREVIFGANGIFSAWSKESRENHRGDRLLIDCTTSSPNLAREIFSEGEKRGIGALDAPVSGGDIGAKNGSLSIMIGGDPEVCESVRSILNHLGSNIVFQGPAGSGQHTKMVNQILIAGNMIGVCEALLYAYRMGLDLVQVLNSVSAGAAGSWSLSNLAPRILQGNFKPGFFVAHFIKDMGIALEEARRMDLSLPGLALVNQLYISLAAQGGAQSGTQALVKALARLSDLNPFPDQNEIPKVK